MSTSKTPSKSKNGAVAVVFFAAVAAVIFLCIKFVVPFAKYGIAKSLIQKEKYEQAVTMLSSLDGYRDSRQILSEVLFEHKEYMQVGMTVEFGRYDGLPIEWYVAEVRGDRIMLFSRYVLAGYAYDNVSYDWETSDIREWMNGEFYESAFTEQEKEQILFDHDNVFLMSLETMTGWGDDIPRDWWAGLDRTGEPVYWWFKGELRGEIGPAVANPKGGYSFYGDPDVGYRGYVTTEASGGQPGVRPCVWIEV